MEGACLNQLLVISRRCCTYLNASSDVSDVCSDRNNVASDRSIALRVAEIGVKQHSQSVGQGRATQLAEAYEWGPKPGLQCEQLVAAIFFLFWSMSSYMRIVRCTCRSC